MQDLLSDFAFFCITFDIDYRLIYIFNFPHLLPAGRITERTQRHIITKYDN